MLDAAWDHGINFFDTANIYGDGRSETYLGEWLEDQDRENFVVASKVYWTTRGRRTAGLSRKIIRAEIEGTLQRLRTDYLDIYYIHGWHATSPLEETLSALDDLVRWGKVHYLGVSNFATWQLMKALWISDVQGWEPISVIQPRYSAVDRVPFTADPEELALPGLLDACRDQQIALCPYSPLAGGFLAGKYERGPEGELLAPAGSRADLSERYGPFPAPWWQVLDAVREVAADVDASPAQVVLRWTMSIEGLTSVPIFGGRSLQQLEENVSAVGDIPLCRTARADRQRRPLGATALGSQRLNEARVYLLVE